MKASTFWDLMKEKDLRIVEYIDWLKKDNGLLIQNLDEQINSTIDEYAERFFKERQ